MGTFDLSDCYISIEQMPEFNSLATSLNSVITAMDTCSMKDCCNTITVGTRRYSIPKIDRYLVEGKAVIVFFADGTKESVVCCDQDTFDLEVGIEKCILKKVCGDDFKLQIKKVIRDAERQKKQQELAKAKAKEEQEAIERKRKKNAERQMLMKARYEAKYQLALQEALNKEKLKEKKKKKDN